MKTKCKQCGRLIDKRGMWKHLKYVHPATKLTLGPKDYVQMLGSSGGEGHLSGKEQIKLVLEPKSYVQMLGSSSGEGKSLHPKLPPMSDEVKAQYEEAFNRFIQSLEQKKASLGPKKNWESIITGEPPTEYALNYCPNCGISLALLNDAEHVNIKFCFSCGCALHLIDLY